MSASPAGDAGRGGGTRQVLAFTGGHALPAESHLARWIACVGLIMNDAIMDAVTLTRDGLPEFERLYYLRIAMGHLREAASFLARTRDVDGVGDLESRLSPEAANDLAIVRVLWDDPDHPLKPYVGGLRHTVFHYPSIWEAKHSADVGVALDCLAGEVVRISAGLAGHDLRAEFADQVAFRLGLLDIAEDEDRQSAFLDAARRIVLALQRASEALVVEYFRPSVDGSRAVDVEVRRVGPLEAHFGPGNNTRISGGTEAELSERVEAEAVRSVWDSESDSAVLVSVTEVQP